jgi:hypothetical protein
MKVRIEMASFVFNLILVNQEERKLFLSSFFFLFLIEILSAANCGAQGVHGWAEVFSLYYGWTGGPHQSHEDCS